MNILYLGPIKSNSIVGIQSRQHLTALNSFDYNIYAKNYGPKDVSLNGELFFLENKPIITNIDLIIEHKPVSDISVNNSKTSILIPIFDKYDNIRILQNYRDIVASTTTEANILKSNKIECVLLNQDDGFFDINYNKPEIELKKYSFKRKIYSILDMSTDENLCTELIEKMSHIIPSLYNHCLVILLNNSNNDRLMRYTQLISSLGNVLGYDLTEHILLLNSSKCEIENMMWLHEHGDVFLDANNKQSINAFNVGIAKKFKTKIISDISEIGIKNGTLETILNYNKIVNSVLEQKQQQETISKKSWKEILK